MEVKRVFDPKFHDLVKNNVSSVLLENSESEIVEEPLRDDWNPDKNTLTCSHCRIQFDDVTQQREHYKLDWHRYNLKQSLLAKQPISEEEFDQKNSKDDISSISGSDSEDNNTLDTYATAQGKIFLQNPEGNVFSIYACLLHDKKDELTNDIVNQRIRDSCITNKKWTVLMLGGGHFAGAIFNGDDAILHKTFHCYTVRAGQGGTQSAKDSKSGGSHPKSAGASLRRYNEQALNQHIKSIVEMWRSEIEQSSVIFYRASGSYNRNVLFGGAAPLLNRNDKRLRTIPFSTRRATFTEVKRVHYVLTMVHVYTSLETAAETFARQKLPDQTKRAKSRSTAIDRAKSREKIERPLPITNVPECDSTSDENELELSTEFENISFQETLQEFDDSLSPEQRKIHQKKKKPRKSKAKKLKEQETKRKNEIIEMLSRGDLNKLSNLLENYAKIDDDSDLVNEVLDDNGNSLLHIAALNEQTEILTFLLNQNANPCLKNVKQCTAYTCTQSNEVRETLKQFARDNPEKYNYNKAQIPTNMLTPDELAEKKKAHRKVKKEKDKIKKKENDVKKHEQQEQERFLKLSDREKRALAAERRIVSQSGEVITRCFLCAADMTGKVPFEYLGYRFCSVDCLKAHRMKNPVILS